jgi:AraC-like DNA-binding protein
MLSATSHRTFGASTLSSTIFLERRFRARLVHRDRLLFDTAFSAPFELPSTYVHLYATLRGAFQPAGGPLTTGPQAWLLADAEMDRVTEASATFRSWGAPCVIVELRIPAPDLRVPIGLRHGPLELPAAVWDAFHALEASPELPALLQLMVRLSEANVLSNDLSTSIVREEPERYVRLWDVLRPMYEEQSPSLSLKQIAAIARLSLRRVVRDFNDLTGEFGLFGAGFRDAMRVLRLRVATLMLSAPDCTPTTVAKSVGYGSLEAMGRAFRDAQLPSPSLVQAAVRYPEPGA